MFRTFETPYVADWLAASLRWIVLGGAVVSWLCTQLVNVPVVAAGADLLWNVIMSILAVRHPTRT